MLSRLQLFLGTIPAVINALFVVFAGNIIVEDPFFRTDKGLKACYDPGLIPHVYGVIAQAYGLLGLLALFLLGKQVRARTRHVSVRRVLGSLASHASMPHPLQVVTRIQVPVLLLIMLFAFSAGWVFVGVAAALAGRDTCAREAPVLYTFSIAQSVLTPLLAVVWILRYGFSSIVWGLLRARASCVRLCWVWCARGRAAPPRAGTGRDQQSAQGAEEEQGEEQGEGEAPVAPPEQGRRR